ncbi:MAG: CoB--CoM heterodisulfide reductase iron-sulfur subunit B family protein [Thermodesulfobacteriota bacterium]
MHYALFLGCKIPNHAPQYEISARRVLKALGVAVKDLPFNCCGYPLRDQYFEAFLLSAARNLALAEAKSLTMLTLCKCCLGSLKRAQSFLAESHSLRTMVNDELAREGLTYLGQGQVMHLQSVLYHQVGLERLADLVTRPFRNLGVATLYGCHALRPSRLTNFDNPYQPKIIDELLEVTGAASVAWEGRLRCCGAPLRNKNEALSLSIIGQRLQEFHDSGADILNVDCPHTLLQVQWAFERLEPAQSIKLLGGIALYPQLLGLAMGLRPSELALELNTPQPSQLVHFQAAPPAEATEAGADQDQARPIA